MNRFNFRYDDGQVFRILQAPQFNEGRRYFLDKAKYFESLYVSSYAEAEVRVLAAAAPEPKRRPRAPKPVRPPRVIPDRGLVDCGYPH